MAKTAKFRVLDKYGFIAWTSVRTTTTKKTKKKQKKKTKPIFSFQVAYN